MLILPPPPELALSGGGNLTGGKLQNVSISIKFEEKTDRETRRKLFV